MLKDANGASRLARGVLLVGLVMILGSVVNAGPTYIHPSRRNVMPGYEPHGPVTLDAHEEAYWKNVTKWAKGLGMTPFLTANGISYDDLLIFLLSLGLGSPASEEFSTTLKVVLTELNCQRLNSQFEKAQLKTKTISVGTVSLNVSLPDDEQYSPYWLTHTDPYVQLLQEIAWVVDKVPAAYFFEGFGRSAHLWDPTHFKDQYHVYIPEGVATLIKRYKEDVEREHKRAEEKDVFSKSEHALRTIVFDYQSKMGWSRCLTATQEFAKYFAKAQDRCEDHLERHDSRMDALDHKAGRPASGRDHYHYHPTPEQEEERAKNISKMKGLSPRTTHSRHTHVGNEDYVDVIEDGLEVALGRLPRRYQLTVVHPEVLHLLPVMKMLDMRFMKVHLVDPDHERLSRSFKINTLIDAHPDIHPQKILLRPNLYHPLRSGDQARWYDEDVSRMVCSFQHMFVQTAKSVQGEFDDFFFRLKNHIRNWESLPANTPKRLLSIHDSDLVIAHDVAEAYADGLLEYAAFLFKDRFTRHGDYSHLPEEFDTPEEFLEIMSDVEDDLRRTIANRFVRSLFQEVPPGGVVLLTYPIAHCFDAHWNNGSSTNNSACEESDSKYEEAIHRHSLAFMTDEERANWLKIYGEGDHGHGSTSLEGHPFVIFEELSELRGHAHPIRHYGKKWQDERKRLEDKEDHVVIVSKVKIVALQWGPPRMPSEEDVPYIGDDYTRPLPIDSEPSHDPEWAKMIQEMEAEERRQKHEEYKKQYPVSPEEELREKKRVEAFEAEEKRRRYERLDAEEEEEDDDSSL